MEPPLTLTVSDAVLDAWERHNRVLLNLLSLVPPHGLARRAADGSPTVAQMFTHMHHERMVSVQENAPECAGPVPTTEWVDEQSADRIADMLRASSACVRNAVLTRTHARRSFDLSFAHPVQLLHFLIFHESYHHGQIKLALKTAGTPIADADAGPLVWGLWRAREVAP